MAKPTHRYLYDQVARYENLMAGHLLKWVNYQQDVLGECYANIDPTLSYFKKKFPDVDALQVCLNPKAEFRNANDIRVVSALSFLQELV